MVRPHDSGRSGVYPMRATPGEDRDDTDERTAERGPLVRRCRRAVTKLPFAQVVSIHGATVLRVCRATVGPVDADDAWSETFLSALRAYPALPVDANVEAWLVTIAHRKAIDVLRRTRRAATPMADLPAGATEDDHEASGAHAMALVGRLPQRQRFAVAYHYLGGLPYAEVAAVIGGTPEAARRAAADGIAKLRRMHAHADNRHETSSTGERR